MTFQINKIRVSRFRYINENKYFWEPISVSLDILENEVCSKFLKLTKSELLVKCLLNTSSYIKKKLRNELKYITLKESVERPHRLRLRGEVGEMCLLREKRDPNTIKNNPVNFKSKPILRVAYICKISTIKLEGFETKMPKIRYGRFKTIWGFKCWWYPMVQFLESFDNELLSETFKLDNSKLFLKCLENSSSYIKKLLKKEINYINRLINKHQ